ncbi:MAG: HDOD domain-containing protein [Desulfobacterales bacterium]|nr:MAG: HDOD domain-containing protein [Desulfobacterales bacterium]
MAKNKIPRIIAEVRSFPGMPATAAKLVALMDNPDSTAVQIEDILKYDPGLTANLLKLTNSAYFGIPNKVSSIRQATVLLGRKRLIQLVLTMCMSSVMLKPVPGYDLPRGELWRHSIAVSVAAEILVKALGITAAEEIFTAALLHDIGKLVLGAFVQEDLPEIKAMVAKGISFEVAEYIALGTDHAQIGAHILKNWSFPAELFTAIRWHHDPESCEGIRTVTDIVHLANALGLMAVGGQHPENLPGPPSSAVTQRLGLDPIDLERLTQGTLQGVNQLADVLGAQPLAGRPGQGECFWVTITENRPIATEFGRCGA